MIMTNVWQVHGHKEEADEPRQRGNSNADCDVDAVVDDVGGSHGGGGGCHGDGNRYGDAGVIMILSLCLSL